MTESSGLANKRYSLENIMEMFGEGSVTPEEEKIAALAHLLRTNRKSALPFFKRLDADKIADALERNALRSEEIFLAVQVFNSNQRLFELASKNPMTPTKALVFMVNRSSDSQLEYLIRDEIRLILAPDLLEALLNKPDVGATVKEKLNNLKQRIDNDPQLQIRAGFKPEELDSEKASKLLEETEETDDSGNIYAMIIKMTAAEKAMLALKANRQTRMLLIKDPNKLVSTSVMRSPRLTDNDVETISRTREVSEDVLRIIAINKRWMRKYIIMKNLALNPRTPHTLALAFLNRLNNNDVKNSARDHNLPAVIRQAAMKLAKKKNLF